LTRDLQAPVRKRQAAVFLDRDGTIIREVNYLDRLEDVELLPETAAAIARLNRHRIPVILVSNQSGVARGKFSESFVLASHVRIQKMLESYGAHLDDFFFCPHHPEHGRPPYKKDCTCRKPEPGLLRQAAGRHQLDLAASFVVGDKLSDVELARRVNAAGILVKTGHGVKEAEKIRTTAIIPDLICSDLAEAVNWIIHQLSTRTR